MRVFKLIAIACIAPLALAGCGSGTNDGDRQTGGATSASGKEKKSLRITLIAKSQNNPVFQAAKIGAEAAAKELSDKEGVDVAVDWQTPPTEDGQEQAKRIAQAVNNGSDAIIIACSDAAKVKGAIDEAVDKGVPVMCFDSDCADSQRFAFYGADDMEAGKLVLDELVAQAKDMGQLNVAILAGNHNAPNLQKRVKGVEEAAKAYPNVKIVNTVYHIESPQDATAAVQREMKAHPEINGWAMVGGWPLFAPALLNELDPAKVKIVAVDCLPAQMPYIEKGIAPVLFAQPIYDWGHTSVNLVYRKVIKGENVESYNKMDLIRVDAASLGDWGKKLQSWGFTDVDPKWTK